MICLKSIAGKIALSGIICALALPYFTQKIEAASPVGTTHQFYGTVISSGGVVGAGYTVSAMVNGQQVASTITDAHGQWGYSPLFIVTAPCDSPIEFYVNGVLAGTAAGCISTNRLDLVYNARPVSSSIASTETATPGAVSSGGTVIFFIGQQPSGSTSAKSTTKEKTPPVAAPPVTSIAVADLAAIPQTAEAGNDVTITVKLLNRGNVEFSGGVVLKINDIVDQQKDVTLAVGDARTVDFHVSKNEPGNYKATIDDYSTDFVVSERKAVNISPSQAAPDASIQQTDDQTGAPQVSAGKDNKLLPDNTLLALMVLVVGGIIAIYLVIIIIRQGSSRY